MPVLNYRATVGQQVSSKGLLQDVWKFLTTSWFTRSQRKKGRLRVARGRNDYVLVSSESESCLVIRKVRRVWQFSGKNHGSNLRSNLGSVALSHSPRDRLSIGGFHPMYRVTSAWSVNRIQTRRSIHSRFNTANTLSFSLLRNQG